MVVSVTVIGVMRRQHLGDGDRHRAIAVDRIAVRSERIACFGCSAKNMAPLPRNGSM
jgi:hypothetical protein